MDVFNTEEHANKLKPENIPRNTLATKTKLLFQWEEISLVVLELEYYHHAICISWIVTIKLSSKKSPIGKTCVSDWIILQPIATYCLTNEKGMISVI